MLLVIALVCGLGGAGYAEQVVSSTRVDPFSLGYVIADAMFATVLIVLAGCAVIGVIVLRGVAEMFNQAAGDGGRVEPDTSADQPALSTVHDEPTDAPQR